MYAKFKTNLIGLTVALGFVLAGYALGEPPMASQALASPEAGLAQADAGSLAISTADTRSLRLIARRTWRFFETFVTGAEHMLPPDNFQEDPRPVIAHRTSPTNIGMAMLSALSAHDFGYISTEELIENTL